MGETPGGAARNMKGTMSEKFPFCTGHDNLRSPCCANRRTREHVSTVRSVNESVGGTAILKSSMFSSFLIRAMEVTVMSTS